MTVGMRYLMADESLLKFCLVQLRVAHAKLMMHLVSRSANTTLVLLKNKKKEI